MTLCSFEIIPSELNNDSKDSSTKLYKVFISLKDDKNYTFKGYISFNKNNNNFIYDFKFDDNIGFFIDTPPPISINFTGYEQFKLFLNYIKENEILINDELGLDLINDSYNHIFKANFAMDFFMEIFKACYSQKEIKLFLFGFKLENSYIPNDFNYQDYSKIIDLIDKNPKIIIRHFREKEDISKYLVKLYTIIFYLRRKYDKAKAEQMLFNKDLYQYFADFLPKYPTFFLNLKCPEELIEKMFKEKLTLDNIEGILSYLYGVEHILHYINKYINEYITSVFQGKNILIMSKFGIAQKNDNLDKIYEEISRILKYEMERKIRFISFDKPFWESYILLNEDLKNLELINKSIQLCLLLEKDLSLFIPILKEKIHKRGIYMIQKGLLKNESLLDFINTDDYFSEYKKNPKLKPISILEGLDFEAMSDDFYEKWKNSNIFAIYTYNIHKFKYALVNLVKNGKDFGKLLKLFDYKNVVIFDDYTIQLLEGKFKDIYFTFRKETCPNLISDIAYYIYIMDFVNNKYIQYFLKDTIERYISSLEILNDIYKFLLINYKDISQNAVESVINYFSNKTVKIEANAIISIICSIEEKGNEKLLELFFNKMEYLAIKEEEIFSKESNIESFKLYNLLTKNKNLMNKNKIIGKTLYFQKTRELVEKVIDKIKKGKIKFVELLNIYENKDRLNILFFNNKKECTTCVELLKENFIKISEIKLNIENIYSVLNEFYNITYKNELTYILNLKNQLQSKMINEISRKELLENLQKLKEKIDDLKNKNIYQKEKEKIIIDKTFKEFNQLGLLFDDNWLMKIPDSILKECYKALKVKFSNENIEDLIQKELNILSECFKIENFSKNDCLNLVENLKIYIMKEDIFMVTKNCMHFIEELGVEKTKFYNELKKINSETKNNKNIKIEDINEYGEILKKYGLNVIDSNMKDKDYLDILQFLNLKENSLKFLVEYTEYNLRNSHGFTFLTLNEIQEVNKCSNFINELLEGMCKKNDLELIVNFVNLVSNSNYKNYSNYFKNYCLNSDKYIYFFYNSKNISQAKIIKILKRFELKLSLINRKNYFLEFYAKFKEDEDNIIKYKCLNFEEVMELKERAISFNLSGVGDEKSNIIFIKKISEIEILYQLLKNLGEKGYCENLKIAILLENSESSFYKDDIKLKDWGECYQILNDILIETTKTQIHYYKKYGTELIRYLYGRQFNLFKSRDNLEYFLKFLTNDSISKYNDKSKYNYNYDHDYDRNLNNYKYIAFLESISKFLNDFLKTNSITLKSIYDQNMIKEEFSNDLEGLFVFHLEDDKIGKENKEVEVEILNLYYLLTGNPPMAQTLLLCNEETTSEEITAFLYRAFLCEYNVLFTIVNINHLSSEKKRLLIDLIISLNSENEKKMKSCLIFFYMKKDEINSIKKFFKNDIKKYLKNKNMKIDGGISYDENVEIFYSDKVGVGKSTQIKLKIEKIKKRIIFIFLLEENLIEKI